MLTVYIDTFDEAQKTWRRRCYDNQENEDIREYVSKGRSEGGGHYRDDPLLKRKEYTVNTWIPCFFNHSRYLTQS